MTKQQQKEAGSPEFIGMENNHDYLDSALHIFSCLFDSYESVVRQGMKFLEGLRREFSSLSYEFSHIATKGFVL